METGYGMVPVMQVGLQLLQPGATSNEQRL